jgi:hypothetical protein
VLAGGRLRACQDRLQPVGHRDNMLASERLEAQLLHKALVTAQRHRSTHDEGPRRATPRRRAVGRGTSDEIAPRAIRHGSASHARGVEAIVHEGAGGLVHGIRAADGRQPRRARGTSACCGGVPTLLDLDEAQATVRHILETSVKRQEHRHGVARVAPDAARALGGANGIVAAAWIHDIGYSTGPCRCGRRGVHPVPRPAAVALARRLRPRHRRRGARPPQPSGD